MSRGKNLRKRPCGAPFHLTPLTPFPSLPTPEGEQIEKVAKTHTTTIKSTLGFLSATSETTYFFFGYIITHPYSQDRPPRGARPPEGRTGLSWEWGNNINIKAVGGSDFFILKTSHSKLRFLMRILS